MSFFNNLKIGRRLGLGFGSQLLMMALILGVGLYNVGKISALVERIVKVNYRKAELTSTLTSKVDNVYIDITEMLTTTDPKELAENKRTIDEQRAEYRKALEELEKLEVRDEGKQLIVKLKSTLSQARDGNNRVIELAMAGKGGEAISLYHVTVKPYQHELVKVIDAMMLYQSQRNTVRFEEVMGYIGMTRTVLIIAGMVALLVSIFLGIVTTFSITRPVAQGVAFADRMAGGDLTQTLEIQQNDEIGNLAAALNQMGASLRKMFREMTEGVRTLSTSATQLAAISRQMTVSAEQSSARAHSVATAAEEMSASLASVASSMDHATGNVNSVAGATEEMTSTINEVARSSDKARTITGQVVEQANQINRQVVELGRAAREIGKVTETIAAISAQTNLLALNATIEAARAGAAGKGFTVVASEIKELAQQTAAATEGIREKIDNIQTSTRETVGDIEKISGVIQEVSEMITSTAEAIEQQSVVTRDIATNIAQAAFGIHEVNDNVTQTSRVSETIAHEITEANQAAGEIATSSSQVLISSEELARLAEHLKQLAGQFRV